MSSSGKLTDLDHVGIAVRDLDAVVEWYQKMFGATVAHRERIDSDGVDEALIKVADSYIQLLTPFRDDSPLAKYMEKNGEGIHHVGYRVDSAEEVLEDVKAQGARVVDEHPRTGSRGTTVAFLHPKTAFGTLIELVQE
ncbi:MAG: methylmalonyl-CoA epimerase [Acidimicrobiia bacterium]|nr:methylmalonyl-CoA epimerase [Acidimicrobiia bacterium]